MHSSVVHVGPRACGVPPGASCRKVAIRDSTSVSFAHVAFLRMPRALAGHNRRTVHLPSCKQKQRPRLMSYSPHPGPSAHLRVHPQPPAGSCDTLPLCGK
eukprot:13574510-Alexandrium_andersonii.AAC.1